MTKKVLLFGANGLLGRYVFDVLVKNPDIQVIPVFRKDYDCLEISPDHNKALIGIIQEHCPSVVVNAIGATPQNSNNEVEFDVINNKFPLKLDALSREFGFYLIHFSTDCVFESYVYRVFEEGERCNVRTDYGITKGMTDEVLQNTTIIRTSFIGEHPNKKGALLEWLKSNKNRTVPGYLGHYWCGTTALEVALLVERIIIDNAYWMGVRHFFNPGYINKFMLLVLLNKLYKLNVKILPMNNLPRIFRILKSSPLLRFRDKTLISQLVAMHSYQFYPETDKILFGKGK